MALNKVTYIARTTPVSSQNLNDIQDEIINNTIPKDTGGTFNGNLKIQTTNATTANTQSLLSIGNNIPEGTVGASYGGIQLYGSNDKYVFIRTPATALSNNHTLYVPDANGTIALADTTYQYMGSIASGSSKAYTIPNTYRGLLHISSGSETAGRNGLYSVICNSSGTVWVAPLVSCSIATITKATNKLTIAITTINSYIAFIGTHTIEQTT